MEILVILIIGWFGSVWWPGIEVDAPPPGGDPWWWSILLGLAGGVSAILVARVAAGSLDALAGMVVLIAAGRVGSGIVASALRAVRK